MAVSQGAPSVNPDEAATLIAEGSLLLDVREPDEWSAGHADAALHIPLASLPAETDKLPLDRPIVCVCRSGGRSGQAADWLKQAGYDAWNLAGGMKAWAATGFAVVDGSGAAGTVI